MGKEKLANGIWHQFNNGTKGRINIYDECAGITELKKMRSCDLKR